MNPVLADPKAYWEETSLCGYTRSAFPNRSATACKLHACTVRSSAQACRLLEGVLCLGTVLHCQGEHLCHKGVLRPQGQRFVIAVDGILYPVLQGNMLLGKPSSANRHQQGMLLRPCHAWYRVVLVQAGSHVQDWTQGGQKGASRPQVQSFAIMAGPEQGNPT